MEINEQIHTRFESLSAFCKTNWEPADVEKIEKAFQFAQEIIGEHRFKTGEVILTHSIDVATVIATEIGLGPDSITSGLLHNVMYAGLERKATQKEIETHFGNKVFGILDGMAKINALGTDTVDLHSEN